MKENFGAILNEEDNRDANVAAWRGPVGLLPSKKITDISGVEVVDQLYLGTCVGQAVGSEITYRIQKKTGKLPKEASRRFLYAMAKAIDGYLGQGTYPRIVYKIGNDDGCAKQNVVPDNNSLPHSEYVSVPRTNTILADAKEFDMIGFGTVDPDVDEMKREINISDVFTCTLGVDRSAWGQSRLAKPNKVTEYHRVMVYGYEDIGSDTVFYFRNSWGTDWGDKGNGSFLFSEYQNYIFDIMLFTDVPANYLEELKKLQYVFKGESIRYGQRGEKVLQLQKRLQKLGHYPEGWEYLTGYFGEITRKSLLEFQLSFKVASNPELLQLNGTSAGPKTMEYLNGKKAMSLVDALIMVESGGDDRAIGDKNLTNKAYGCLQIRKPYVDDVNKALGTSYKAEDCLGNRNLSIKIFNAYMAIYATPERLGRPVMDQDVSRVHNGGPNGWRIPATIPYWEKVKKYLN
ncbi:MAG: peptidoglycan-binding protein [Candidatus Gracilibacteria bacterium]|nr:peptidoglycan-binding protein [Candidatus Gracilibacteria bacterium]